MNDLSALTTQLSQRLGLDLEVELHAASTVAPVDGPPQASELGPGEALGEHLVLGVLGAGGMGEVLLVNDRNFGRQLAAKVVRSEATDPWLLARFLVEARITGQLQHPGIVPVHALGVTAAGRLYMTMKRVAGRTLRELLLSEDPPIERLLEIMLKVCDAVHFAHSRGVVHRDLKPDNVMVGEFGEVQVVDWGVAKVLATDGGVAIDLARAADEAGVPDADALATRAGGVVGTVMYMAPEQAGGQPIDVRADVYALGATLYTMLARVLPFSGDTGPDVLAQVLAGRLDRPSVRAPGRAIPSELEAVVLRAMARDAGDRYPDVAHLRADLSAFLGGRPVSAARYSRWARLRLWTNREPLLVTSVLIVTLVLATLGAGIPATLRRRRQRHRGEAIARAALLRAAGDATREEAELRTAARLDPAAWEAHVALGLHLRRGGKEAEARASLERARALAPDAVRPLIDRLLE